MRELVYSFEEITMSPNFSTRLRALCARILKHLLISLVEVHTCSITLH